MSFPCTTCGEGFPTEEALMAHVEEEHKGERSESAEAVRAIEFPRELKEQSVRVYDEWKDAGSLDEAAKKSRFGRALRVTARYLPSLRKELRSGELVWHSDASKAAGGLGEHPGALQHFIAGLPLCQMTHWAERASAWGLRLVDLEVSAVGRFVAIAGRGFDSVEYEVRVESPEPEGKIRELAEAAANDCYVTNTLKRSCEVKGRVRLNGVTIAEL
jgi:uncharacterized OsmC-like protein